MHNYQIFGEEPVKVVVEMGLGSCLSEWIPMAKLLCNQYGVLLYERAGINKSTKSGNARTPYHIAAELFELLKQVNHTEKIILLAHSQGGLYAQQFCRQYPELVEKVIFLDPLSAKDNEFKTGLTKSEYKKSGVDKSLNFKIMRVLAKWKMGSVMKAMLKNAPPLYYYKEYSEDEIKDILNSVANVIHATTVLEEYEQAHIQENLSALADKKGFPQIPLILITHDSERAIEESMKFGGNSKEFSTKIEVMWQELMKEYLEFSDKSLWIQAKESTHYIHLQEPQLIVQAVNRDMK